MKTKTGKQLVKRKEVKDSPFVIITEKGESFGVLGQFRLTEKRKTVKEVEKELTQMTWNNIVKVMTVLIESMKDFERVTTNKTDK